MSIDYQRICGLYDTIIHEIFKCIEEDSPSYWDGETNRMVYSKEYLHAYSYLQRCSIGLDLLLQRLFCGYCFFDVVLIRCMPLWRD